MVLFCRLSSLKIEMLTVIELKNGVASGQYPLTDSIAQIGNTKHIQARGTFQSSLKAYIFFLLKREEVVLLFE